MIKYSLMVLAVTFFAMNMGGSNFGVSFAAAHGGGILSKRKARVLFAVFVLLGAVVLGWPVASTLGNRIISPELINFDVALIIISSATASLFVANVLHVPQSTSLVTVASLVGVGLYFGDVNTGTLLYLLPFWVLLPVMAYFLTFFLGKIIYPPRKINYWIYEKLVNHKDRLKAFVIAASCFNAFSVGTNNVANAAAPLVTAGVVGPAVGLSGIGSIFGLGSLVFHGPLKTTGEKIVPLGLVTATIISIVTGILMIVASLCGVPQSFVMMKVASVFAIGGLKNGQRSTFANPLTRKVYLTWIVTPVIALVLSFLMMRVRHAYLK